MQVKWQTHVEGEVEKSFRREGAVEKSVWREGGHIEEMVTMYVLPKEFD